MAATTRRSAPKSLARVPKATKAGSKTVKGHTAPAKARTAPAKARTATPKTRSKAPHAARTRRGPAPAPAADRITIEVDERTLAMTMAALECRESGHHWARVPQGADRRAALAAGGEAETVRACIRCASTKTELYRVPSFEYVEAPVYKWSEGYLIAKTLGGQGRLSRAEVRKAMFARENPDLVLVA